MWCREEVRRVGLGKVRKIRVDSKWFINEYIDGIRFEFR